MGTHVRIKDFKIKNNNTNNEKKESQKNTFLSKYRANTDGTDGKEYACNTGDPDLIPGSGSSPGEGNGHPLQYACLENPMDHGDW